MAEMDWEKQQVLTGVENRLKVKKSAGRWKFLIVGLVILAAMAYLLLSSTLIGARYYMTVDELVAGDNMGKNVRVSGAVDGDPTFDPATGMLTFVVANIPNNNDDIRAQGGLARVLYNAVNDPNAPRLKVIAFDKEIPDLLQHEAQAIMSGKLIEYNGEIVFEANEIMLKCPTKYEEDVPNQAQPGA